MSHRATKTQLIEVVVPASSTAQRFQIPDQPQLREKFVQQIEFYNVKDIPLAPSGNATLSAANVSKSFLTLYTNEAAGQSGEFVQQYPCTTLHRTQLIGGSANTDNPSVYELDGFNNKKVDFSKSYITSSSSVSSVAATSYLFNVCYTDQPTK